MGLSSFWRAEQVKFGHAEGLDRGLQARANSAFIVMRSQFREIRGFLAGTIVENGFGCTAYGPRLVSVACSTGFFMHHDGPIFRTRQ